MTDWRISVDPQRCLGSGSCAAAAPSHFSLVGDRATATGTLVAPDDAVIEAAELCPVEAIQVYDAVTGDQLAPPPDNNG